MTDLAERLREIERNPSPDLWGEITDRTVGTEARRSGPSARRLAIIAASLAIGLAAVAWVVIAIRPTTSPPIIADQPILSPAPRSDCPTGLVRTAPVSTAEYVRLTEGYLPTWMPEGFGVLATYGPETAADGYRAYGIWSDQRCREVEYAFNPNWVARSPEFVNPAASVGPWVVEEDVPGGCGNAVLGEARCLRYSTSTPGGLFSLSMMGLDRDEGDRIALSIYSAESPPVGPSPAASDVEATRMPGIDAYKVCRVLSLPGDFGDAGDEVVVFEEERVPAAGCAESEGFQHVAVLRDGRMTALSRRITDVFDEDVWRVWPYATPDLNGDGVDEIAIALRHEPGNATRVWFFVLSPDGSGLEGIYNSQDSVAFTVAFSSLIGTGTDPLPYLLPRGTYGVFCDGVGNARQVVTWHVDAHDPSRVAEKAWSVVSTNVAVDSEPNIVDAGSSGYPEDGSQELCGSPVSTRTTYPGQARA